jgi:hypothetical protein
MVARSGASTKIIVDPDAPASPARNGTPEVLRVLHAQLGDKFFSTNTPEDSCQMEVISHGGELGVEAHAAFRGTQASDFIAAR